MIRCRWFAVNVRAVIVVIVAAIVLGILAGQVISHRGQPITPPNPPASTFTWEGTTWDCGQVAAWVQQYGAYEPDGTPIPYEVVMGCGS